MRHAVGVVVLGGVLLAGGGCGASSPEAGMAAQPLAADQAAPPSVINESDLALVEIPDPCALLSREEIVTAVGPRELGPERQESAPNGGRGCSYPARSGGSVNIAVGVQSADSFQAVRGLLDQEANKPESVADIGDEAYYWADRIYVRVGKRSLTIWIGSAGRENRAAVLALAKVVVPKLR